MANELKCTYNLEIGWRDNGNQIHEVLQTAVSSSIDELKDMLMDTLHKELGIFADGYHLSEDNIHETCNENEGYRYEVAEPELVRYIEYDNSNPNDLGVIEAHFFARIEQIV